MVQPLGQRSVAVEARCVLGGKDQPNIGVAPAHHRERFEQPVDDLAPRHVPGRTERRVYPGSSQVIREALTMKLASRASKVADSLL